MELATLPSGSGVSQNIITIRRVQLAWERTTRFYGQPGTVLNVIGSRVSQVNQTFKPTGFKKALLANMRRLLSSV